MVWEKKIFHAGLKAYRVVRGPDAATVEFRAQLQTQAWDDRWRTLQLADAKRKKQEEMAAVSFQKKELALRRTREIEQSLEHLTTILRDGIEIDHTFDWDSLKDCSSFLEAPPTPLLQRHRNFKLHRLRRCPARDGFKST